MLHNKIGPVWTHTYFYSTTYIYMLAAVFDNGVIFLARCVWGCFRLCVRKWGAQRPRAGNPFFYSVSWVTGAQQLPQEAPEIHGVVLERHAANGASGEGGSDSDLWTRSFLSGLYQGRSPPSRADMPRTAGRMGFSGCRSENFDGKAQNEGPGKMANIFVLARPSSFLCFLVARLDFAKNGILKIDKLSLKPLKT